MTWLLALACTGKPATSDSGATVDSEVDECIYGLDPDDNDCDGWSVADGDCDDDDAYAYPGADDVPYDGVDNDCAGDGDLVDMDGDGFDSDRVEGGTDCNDGNPTIYPGAPEVCYDDIDQDCAGDEDSNDCDGDGYDGAGDAATDCNDNDPDIYPGQEEIWYDDIDQDCSGYLDSDFDQDGDGEDSDAHEQPDGTYGTDCDDEDPLTGTGLSELWDGQDRNCDGDIDNFSWANAWSAWSPKSGEGDGFIGMGGAVLDDLGGDGFADIAMCGMGSEFAGGCYVISAEQTGIPSLMYHARIDGGESEYFGFDAENAGDLTGDGKDELIVGSIRYGGVGSGLVFDGADLEAGGDLSSSDRMAYFTGNTYMGVEVFSTGDIDGDGVNEIGGGTGWLLSEAHVVVYSGADVVDDTKLSPVDAIAQFDAPSGGDVGGMNVGGLDYDGDGLGDILMGAYTSGTGAVIPIPGSTVATGGSFDISDMTWIRGDDNTAQAGLINGFISDLDDDGYDELLIHVYNHAGAATEGGGRVYLLDGDEVPAAGEREYAYDLSSTYIDGTLDFGHVHTAERSFDVDGNGVQDVIAVESGDRNFANVLLLEGNGPVSAQSGVIYGEDLLAGGAIRADLNHGDAVFLGREYDDLTGYTALAADLDFDGLGDFVFGAPAGSASAGQVYSVINNTDGVY